MSSYIINGGNKLKGTIPVSGSKNAALGIVAAACVLDGPCVIENLPAISDVKIQAALAEYIGATVEYRDDGSIYFDPTTINTAVVDDTRASDIRASYYLFGALLARFGKVKSYLPGGCDLGTRPIDLHIKGFNSMGASSKLEHGFIELEAKDGLHGEHIFLDKVSVGATINIMIAASKAKGRTTIENAAREPHVVDTANFLNAMGADIKGAGTDVIRIEGKERLEGNNSYAIIPDQIEAGTYMIAGAITRGDVTVTNLIPKHMEPLTAKLEEMDLNIEVHEDSIRVSVDEDKDLKATSVRTMVYPGFPTDLQPQTVALMTQLNGLSRMYEEVWDNRFQYITDLKKMGADIRVEGSVAFVNGPSKLSGAKVEARDLRAGAAMVLAALAAYGQTEVYNIESLERGYEKLVSKLRAVGADISLKEPK